MSEQKFIWLELDEEIRQEVVELIRNRIGSGVNAIGLYDTKAEMARCMYEDLTDEEKLP